MFDNPLFSNIADILYAVFGSVIGLWLLQFNLSPFFVYVAYNSFSPLCWKVFFF